MSGPSSSLMNQQKQLGNTEASMIPQFQNLSTQVSGLAQPLTNLAQTATAGIAQPYASGTGILNSLIAHYSEIASGDSQKIQGAIAPTVEAITSGTQREKQNIQADLPRSGVRDLALENADISKVASIGSSTNQAYEGSFGALGQLATQQLGISQQQLQDVLAAYGAATGTYQLAGQELSGGVNAGTAAGNQYQGVLNTQSAQKGAQMGLIGSLVGAGGTLGAAAIPTRTSN